MTGADASTPAPGEWTPPPDDPEAWTRAVALGRSTFAPISSAVRHLWLASGLGVGLAVGMLVAGASPIAIVGLTAATVVVAIALAALPFRDPRLRAATELVWNHQLREARDWKRETGTTMPRGRTAIRLWLEAHPESPERGTLLTVIGRFADAELAWRDAVSPTPDALFALEVQRGTTMLYANGQPDIARLHELWRRLPDAAERAARRECLAHLEAQSDVGRADPVGVLAAARPEGPPIAWRVRWPMALVWNASIPMAVAVVVAGIQVLLG